ncbi:MAG: hypothetical protein D3923_16380 [Candidatus Electrothrix sp. AR3]|nr:hypothetical protein [Candidatus Electrothrix sp. AR3]
MPLPVQLIRSSHHTVAYRNRLINRCIILLRKHLLKGVFGLFGGIFPVQEIGCRVMMRDIADRIQLNGGTNMDFITSAIASAVGSLGLEGVKHGYTKLKGLLQGKFGEKSELAEAVEQLEKNPDSAARKAVVAEELAKVGADKDEEIVKAAKALALALEKDGQVSGKYQVDARKAKIGVMGDHAKVKDGIHFGDKG